jgi:hypothetical protein
MRDVRRTKTEGGRVHPCRAIPDRVPEDETLCRRKPVANAIGHIDDRAGVLSIRD